ncbi:MAG: hypothetical protein CMK34_05630, partial [Porticoccaceae bacterium]|nr:hypothetical protein [Porticoccaceae bacterium]
MSGTIAKNGYLDQYIDTKLRIKGRLEMFISRNLTKALAVLAAIAVSSATLGQDDEQLEEVVVVGSQIKGAAIDTALPVSVITSDDIDILGVDSGVELLENM